MKMLRRNEKRVRRWMLVEFNLKRLNEALSKSLLIRLGEDVMNSAKIAFPGTGGHASGEPPLRSTVQTRRTWIQYALSSQGCAIVAKKALYGRCTGFLGADMKDTPLKALLRAGIMIG